jgi:tetratricopeptide (TPR) repeat protein
MGGVGKTELALQYAWQHIHGRDVPPERLYTGGICWLQARDLDLGTQIVAFARAHLQLHPPEDLELSLQVAYCWRHWLPGEVLVVLDDVTDYQDVKPHLPPVEPRFKVLMTTRVRLGPPIERLDLDVLTLEAALALLKSLIGDKRVEAELDVAEQLCQWLGNLPLGLELVGRYLAIEEDLSLAEIQEQLAQSRLEDEALVETQPEMTARLGVAAAFELSWKRLDENAQVLGYLLSLFALAPIPWSLVESMIKDEFLQDLKKARRALVQFNLIKRTEKETYQLHQLIREFFGAKREKSAKKDDLKRGFCRVMVAEAEEIPDTPTLEQIKAVTPVIPHLAEAATTQQDWLTDDDLFEPFFGLGRFYTSQGVYHEAVHWHEQCLSATRQRFGEQHPDVANSLNNLALLYQAQEHYDQAEPLFFQALELRKCLLGQDHLDFGISLNNLALLYQDQGRYSEAEPLFLQALELNKRLLGQDHPDIALSLNNLAGLYHTQERYEEAEPLYLQALELWKRLRREEHPNFANGLNNLAVLYYAQECYEKAEPLFLQALELRQRLLVQDHPDIALSLNNLAGLYHAQERYEKAEPLFLQALELNKRLLGQDHSDIAQNLNNLAALYESQEHYDQAEPFLLQALAIAERKLGINHPTTVTIRENLQNLRDNHTS